jgi:hypothetical protein
MSMSALPTWSDRSENEAPSGDAPTRNGGSPWLMLFPLGAAAISAAVMLRKPAVRKAAGDVVRDPEVREVCKDAGERAYRVIAASWRRHGGPTGLAETFLR